MDGKRKRVNRVLGKIEVIAPIVAAPRQRLIKSDLQQGSYPFGCCEAHTRPEGAGSVAVN